MSGAPSRLALVLAVVAGLLVGGPAAARTAQLRVLVAVPAVAPAVPVAHPARATGLQRTGGADRAAVLSAASAAASSCAGAGGACALPPAPVLPGLRGARAGRPPRTPVSPPVAPASTQQDRAPPRPAGP